MNQPISAEGGDDQDEIAAMYQVLLEDARERGLPQDEFYYIEDHMLRFFVSVQGYENMYRLVQEGKITRLQMAYCIWRDMPEVVYTRLVAAVLGTDPEKRADRTILARGLHPNPDPTS
jgi:hypothetical protein